MFDDTEPSVTTSSKEKDVYISFTSVQCGSIKDGISMTIMSKILVAKFKCMH